MCVLWVLLQEPACGSAAISATCAADKNPGLHAVGEGLPQTLG